MSPGGINPRAGGGRGRPRGLDELGSGGERIEHLPSIVREGGHPRFSELAAHAAFCDAASKGKATRPLGATADHLNGCPACTRTVRDLMNLYDEHQGRITPS